MYDSAQLKRMILANSESSGIRKKIVDMRTVAGMTDDDLIEMGQAMENTVNTKGWYFIEAYLVKKCDPAAFLFGPENSDMRGEARGAINLMHYIQETIKYKNELLKRANDAQGTLGKTPDPA